MLIEYLVSAVVLGIVVAIPPGSVTIAACQRALQCGFRNSLMFTFGSCLSDIFYILLVYYGVGGWIGIAGNFFLIWNERFPYSKNIGIISILLIMAGVLLWFIPLTFLVSRLRKVINRRLKTYLIIISGICLIIFGILGLYYSIMTMWG